MSRWFMLVTSATAAVASMAVIAAPPATPEKPRDASRNDRFTFSPDSALGAPLKRTHGRRDHQRPKVSALAEGPTGESCADPFVIPSLPFSDDGSTVGRADDHVETCTVAGFGGPDVVYAFTATEDIVVDISLCRDSAFDTRLYVYEDDCIGASVIACNEDQCPTPSQPNALVSQVFDVQFFTGSTYYIVVDGFNGISSGNYTLDITFAVPPCPVEDLLQSQPHSMPDNAWTFGSSDTAVSSTRWEEFSVEAPICGVRWWGLQLFNSGGGFVACSEDPVSFTVNFHLDDAGAPGEIACSYETSLSPEPTGIYFLGFEMVEFNLDVSLQGCCDLPSGWMSIVAGTDAKTDDPECWFLWASSGDNGAPGASHLVDDGGGITSDPYDLSFCLTTGIVCPGDVEGVTPGSVDIEDLLAVLGDWGPCPEPCPPNCITDLVPDCVVDINDLLFVLGNWGPCE